MTFWMLRFSRHTAEELAADTRVSGCGRQSNRELTAGRRFSLTPAISVRSSAVAR